MMTASVAIGLTYPDLEQLTELVTKAQPGLRAFYAIGTDSLNKANPVVQAVNRWAAQGTVRLHFAKNVGYFLIKRDTALPLADGATIVATARAVATDPAERALLEYIAGLASDGLPMPTNGAIAEELGWGQKDQVRYRLNKLVDRGVIAIAAAIPAGARVVRIIASGQMTHGTTVQGTTVQGAFPQGSDIGARVRA